VNEKKEGVWAVSLRLTTCTASVLYGRSCCRVSPGMCLHIHEYFPSYQGGVGGGALIALLYRCLAFRSSLGRGWSHFFGLHSQSAIFRVWRLVIYQTLDR